MQLLPRYIVKQAALTTILISVVLTLIIWLTQSLRLLDFIINGNAPMTLFGKMLLLTVPRFFEIILPISLALGIVYTLNKFSTDSELVVMQNSGIRPVRLGSGLLYFSVFIALFVLVLSGWGTPWANRELDNVRNIVKSDYSLGLLRPGIFNELSDDTTIYIAERSSLQDLKGVFIYFNKAGELPTTITAKHGGILTKDQKVYVLVFNGTRQQFNKATGTVETLKFERYSLDLSSLTNRVMDTIIEPNDRTLPELFATKDTTQNPKEKSRIIAEIHNRLARPFLILALALMTLVPFLTGGHNRRGQPLRILALIGGILALQSVFLGASSLAATSTFGLLLLYGVPLAIIIVYATALLSDRGYRALLGSLAWLMGGKERLV